MKKLLRAYIKKVNPAVLAVLVIFGIAAPVFIAGAANQTQFNTFPNDLETTLIANGSQSPGCSECWEESIDGVEIGDIISVRVYYHNTAIEDIDAIDTRVRVVPTNVGPDSIRLVGRVFADNASSASGAVEAEMENGQEVGDLEHVSTLWYPERSVSNPTNLSGDVTSSSGVSIGDIEASWDAQGFVVANFRVLGEDGPEPNGDDPEIRDIDADDIDEDSATLICEVDPNGEDTEVWFEYGEDDDNLDEDTSEKEVDAGDGVSEVEFHISGLDEDTRYYYQCFAENSEGDDESNIEHFRTDENGGNGPDVRDIDIDDIDEDSADVICEVDPNGEDTDVWVEYGEGDDENDLDDETNEKTIDENDGIEKVSFALRGLDENTEYVAKCFAENRDGDDESKLEDFKTKRDGGGDDPDVETLSPTSVTSSSATLRGEVDPNGEDTDVWFEWGTSRFNLNRTTGTENVDGDENNERFDRRITGLSAGTTYYYRAVAESDEGDDTGSVESFRTEGAIIPPVVPPTIITRIVERFVEEEPEEEGLIVTLDSDKRNIENDEVVYTVSYENRTEDTFTNAEFVIEIPNELDFVDADPREDDTRGGDIIYEIGTIRPGDEESFIIETELESGLSDNERIVFTATLNYVDQGNDKKVVVIDDFELGEARRGGFAAVIADAFRGLFTNPIFWLLLLIALIFFVYRYFASLARPKEDRVQVIQAGPSAPTQQQLTQ